MKTLIYKVIAVIVAAFIAVMANATTVSKTMKQIAEANGWVTSAGSNAVCYNSFRMDDVVIVEAIGDPNCGSFWGDDWRFYQSKNGVLLISVEEGYTIETVKVTYNYRNGGSLRDADDNELKSGVPFKVNDEWIAFEVFSNTGKTSGQVKVTAIEVVYHGSGEENDEPSDELGKSVSTAYSVGQVLDLAKNGTVTDSPIFIKGVVVKIEQLSTRTGFATYCIADDEQDGTECLRVYRGYSLENKKFASETEIVVGDTVVVYGSIAQNDSSVEVATGNYLCQIEKSSPLKEVFLDADDDVPAYRIDGRRAYGNTRGIVIKNGKKYIVR